jgi:hypothetical protein
MQLVRSVDDGSAGDDPHAGSETTDAWLVRCLNVAGAAARELGCPAEAAEKHIRALKLARAMGLGSLVADSTRGLGRAMMVTEGEQYASVAEVIEPPSSTSINLTPIDFFLPFALLCR